MSKFLIFTYLLALILGCSQRQEPLEHIEPKSELITNNNCLNQSKGYYNRFGYNISNYFEFSAVEAKDLDNNGVIDSIGILSPLELLPEFDFCHKQTAGFTENRLLLVNLMSTDGTILKKYKYDNVVSNRPTQTIKKGEEYIDASDEQTGFVLFQDFGQGCYVQYYLYINYFSEESDFIIDSLLFKSACPIDTIETTIKHQIERSPFYLKEYNRSILDEPLEKLFSGKE